MPLSEQEQRLLDEMERNLYKHEADIVQTTGGPRTVNYTRVALGLVIVVAGLGLIVAGVATQLPILGVAGFGLAVVGSLVAIASSKPVTPDDQSGKVPSKAKRTPRAGRSSLMDRLSDEWDKRQQ